MLFKWRFALATQDALVLVAPMANKFIGVPGLEVGDEQRKTIGGSQVTGTLKDAITDELDPRDLVRRWFIVEEAGWATPMRDIW